MKMSALLSTFANSPSFVDSGSQHRFEASLEMATTMLARIEAASDSPVMADDFWFSADDWRAAYRPYVVKDGILLIPVKGVLLHDFGYQLGSWATGYTYITQALRRGLADDQVKGIAFICDSPGGHVAGNFELVDEIFAARGKKPIRGYAAESAYSAAYSIISAVDQGQITVTRTGGVGSIGVLTMHLDVSGAMEQAGYKITYIHAGKHKVDGNPYEVLPADVKARKQAQIDELMTVFVSTVARNRGMNGQVIRDFEALTFTASESKANGLADEIGSLDDAIATFAADPTSRKEQNMSVTQRPTAGFDAAVADTAQVWGSENDLPVHRRAAEALALRGEVGNTGGHARIVDPQSRAGRALALSGRTGEPNNQVPMAASNDRVQKALAFRASAPLAAKSEDVRLVDATSSMQGRSALVGSRADRALAARAFLEPRR